MIKTPSSWKHIFTYFNKYQITLVIFVILIVFVDENNLVHRSELSRKERELRKEIKFYRDKIEDDKKKLEELNTNNENLEKFAREQYLMKKEDEEIFLFD